MSNTLVITIALIVILISYTAGYIKGSHNQLRYQFDRLMRTGECFICATGRKVQEMKNE